MTKNPHEQALHSIAHGASVIPLKPNSKIPAIPSWAEYQTRLPTVDEINDWWAKHPTANIAMVTGAVSKFTVIDIDVKDSADDPHLPVLDRSKLPPTLTIKTPSGGYHLYYRYTDQVKTGVRRFRRLDIRNDGGYVVIPPSTIDGIAYQVVDLRSVAEFPVELFGGAKPSRSSGPAFAVSEGARNATATSMAGKIMRYFPESDWDMGWELLKAWNSRNNPPLPELELRTVFQSVSRYHRLGLELPDGSPLAEDEAQLLPLAEVAKFHQNTDFEFYSTGFEVLDKAMKGGFRAGDLIVLSGKAGYGKTLMAQTLTFAQAERGIPSLWFTYELTPQEVWERFTEMGANETMITYAPLRLLSGKPSWIAEKIIEGVEKRGAKFAFIDHLGYLQPDDPNKDDLASMRLASICRALKRLAIDRNIVIVLMVHVRKSPMFKKEDVDLDDLAYSAGIGQEADHVMILTKVDGKTMVKLVKNRRTGKLESFLVDKINGMFVPLKDSHLESPTFRPSRQRDDWGGF